MHELDMKGEADGRKALAAENASAVRAACGVMGWGLATHPRRSLCPGRPPRC